MDGLRTAFRELVHTTIAAAILTSLPGLFAFAGTWWRNRAQDTITLPTWLAAILAGLLVGAWTVLAVRAIKRYRRRRKPDAVPSKRIEMSVGVLRVRVSRELRADRYLDSDWAGTNWEKEKITKPLCSNCKREVMRHLGYGKWEIVGRCRCDAEITKDGRPFRMVTSDAFKRYVFEQLQRRHRAGRPLKEGTQLLESGEDQMPVAMS